MGKLLPSMLLEELLQLDLLIAVFLVLEMVEPLVLLLKAVLSLGRFALKGEVRVTEAELLLLMRGIYSECLLVVVVSVLLVLASVVLDKVALVIVQ